LKSPKENNGVQLPISPSKKEEATTTLIATKPMPQEKTFLNLKRKMGENINKILTDEQIKDIEKKKKKSKKRKDKKRAEWYVPKVNSNVYVNNLPKDITELEIVEYFSRCGFIRKDQRTGDYKVKLYKNEKGINKGDALISFLREESVTMAIDLLNQSEIRPGHKIIVERAKFEQKGDYKTRESYRLDEIQRYKLRTEVGRKLGWNEEDDEKGLKIVIFKNMFEVSDFFEDEGFEDDLKLDIIEGCEEKFGKIDKFLIFYDNPQGIIKVKFHNPASAEKCIEELNGTYYNGRLIEVFYWDSKTDYNKFQEDEKSQEKRLDEFGQWLEGGESKEEKEKNV
jgi:HIV Tat-specific factor 1